MPALCSGLSLRSSPEHSASPSLYLAQQAATDGPELTATSGPRLLAKLTGVDGVTWKEYECLLPERIPKLHREIHTGAYRALPSRRVFIPKADGRQRPLGIASIEDKIAQQAVSTVLSAIYEEDFLGFSYGFRQGRSQHDALDALTEAIRWHKVNWILDADIQSFLDRASYCPLIHEVVANRWG